MKIFFPKEDYESVYHIPIEKYKRQGIKAIFFDIDNTIALHGKPAKPEIIDFFKVLHKQGIQTVLISNNKKERVESFARQVDSPYIYDAKKPKRTSYRKALDMAKADMKEAVFVGDQIFTDIYGANRAGIHSILVKPIAKSEELQIILKRLPEKLILKFYHIHKRKQNV